MIHAGKKNCKPSKGKRGAKRVLFILKKRRRIIINNLRRGMI